MLFVPSLSFVDAMDINRKFKLRKLPVKVQDLNFKILELFTASL